MSRFTPSGRTWPSQAILMAAVAVILLMAVPALATPQHVVMFSNYIRPGDQFSVDINMLPNSPSVTVTLDVGTGTGRSFISKVSQSTSISSGDHAKVDLMIPDGLTGSGTGYSLRIMGLNATTVYMPLELLTKTSSVFVQTDKATYKPGDTVQFRVVLVDPDLIPLNGPVSIKINNPDGNAIQQWIDETLTQGLFQGEIELPDFVTLGTWTIKVEYGAATAYDKHFEVDEYVLPKFEVDVTFGPFLVVRSFEDTLLIKLKVMYTFGQPVQGTADIIIPSPTGSGSDYKLLGNELDDSGMFSTRVSLRDVCKSCRQASELAHYTVTVTGNVTETATGVWLAGSGSPLFSTTGLKIEFSPSTSETFKAGMPYTAYVQVTQPDGSPLDISNLASDAIPDVALSGDVTCNYREEDCTGVQLTEITEPLTQSGILQFELSLTEVTAGHNALNLRARIRDPVTGNDIVTNKRVDLFESESNEAVQVTQRTTPGASTTVEPDSQVTFDVMTSADVPYVSYQVYSRSLLVLSGRSATVAPTKSHSLTLSISAQLAKQLAPTARIILFYVTSSGEVVADTKQFGVNGALANHVTVEYSQSTVEPGAEVQISGMAEAGSLVALLAVDQSVLLLASGNDIDEDAVLAEVSSYDSVASESSSGRGCWWGARRRRRSIAPPCWFNAGSSTSDLLRNSKVSAVTDALIYGGAHIVIYYSADYDELGGIGDLEGEIVLHSAISEPELFAPVTSVRSVFDETWIFSTATAGIILMGYCKKDVIPGGRLNKKDGLTRNDGQYSLPARDVPDTITSWVLSGFALHDVVGMGVANPATLTTFKAFFASLSLPYSVRRGEKLIVKATVFNYLQETQQVLVTLKQSNKFDYIDLSRNGTLVQRDVQITLTVGPQSAKTAEYWISMSELGDIPIEVHAQSPQAADALVREILVKPEGEEKEACVSELITLSDGETIERRFNPNFPDNVVRDSAKIFLRITGSVLGPAMENLDELLRMPTGCGEQTMIGLAPDVYISRYLKVTEQLDSDVYQKAIKYMKSGYTRELTYKHSDGSFSAFGERDGSGSTWLTAFVALVFHQAKEFITVDDTVIDRALIFVMEQQNPDGSFNVVGTVHHDDLMGGASDGVAFSAYCTLALLECGDFGDHTGLSDLSSKTQLAVTYLENQLAGQSENSYSLAIMAYALAKANSNRATDAFNMLDAKAIVQDGFKYWTASGEEETEPPPSNRWSYRGTPSTSIEMTGYAMLATLEHDNGIVNSLPISKWLTSKQNRFGGYTSTQDTVIGIHALASLEVQTGEASGGQNLRLSVMAGNEDFVFETITEANKDILQVKQFPNVPEVVLTATGPGSAVVKFVTEFNIPVSEPSGDIELQVTVGDTEDNNEVDVNSCVRWKGQSASGMGIVQVSALSGFANDVTGLVDQYKMQGLKMAELKDNNLIMYWDEIPTDQICVKTTQRREYTVTGLQSAQVVSYSYYDPASVQVVNYLPEQLANISPCEECPTCTGCSGVGGTAIIYPCSVLLTTLLVVVASIML